VLVHGRTGKERRLRGGRTRPAGPLLGTPVQRRDPTHSKKIPRDRPNELALHGKKNIPLKGPKLQISPIPILLFFQQLSSLNIWMKKQFLFYKQHAFYKHNKKIIIYILFWFFFYEKKKLIIKKKNKKKKEEEEEKEKKKRREEEEEEERLFFLLILPYS
jgi:hypothetical protein